MVRKSREKSYSESGVKIFLSLHDSQGTAIQVQEIQKNFLWFM